MLDFFYVWDVDFPKGIGTMSGLELQVPTRASLSAAVRGFPYRRSHNPNAHIPSAFPAMIHPKDTPMPRPKQANSNNAHRYTPRAASTGHHQ